MAIQIPDLWPPEVAKVKVLTPLLILKHQAGLLRKLTSNVLEAEVTTEADAGRELDVCHYLDLVVPALDRFEFRLLNLRHSKIKVYPAYIFPGSDQYSEDESRCNSQGEFIARLGEMLNSPDVRSAIESLLAQATESANENVVAD